MRRNTFLASLLLSTANLSASTPVAAHPEGERGLDGYRCGFAGDVRSAESED
jgi:hypothetical protein